MNKWFSISIVMVLAMSLLMGCGDTSSDSLETTPIEIPTYNVYLDIIFDGNILMNLYDVDIYFDEAEVGSIEHGNNFTLMIEDVQEGDHELIFYKEGDESVEGSTKVKVIANTTFKCTIHAKGSEIKIDEIDTLKSIEGSSFMMSDVVGMNLQDTLDQLSGTGFTNVSTKAEDDGSIWDNSNWTVITQSINPNTEIDKNEEIILTCIKTQQYISNNFSDLTLVDAMDKALELGYLKISYINIITSEDMTSQIEEMPNDEVMNWTLTKVEERSSDVKTLEFSIIYAVPTGLQNIIGMNLQETFDQLKEAGYVNVTAEVEGDGSIWDKTNWTVIAQNFDSTSEILKNEEIVLTCIKTKEYIRNIFSNTTLADARDMVIELGYSNTSYENISTSEDMTLQVNEMSNIEAKNWKIIETKDTSSDVKTLELSIVYAAPIEVPKVVGESLSLAINKLKAINIYNVEEKTEEGSKIYDDENWTVTEQSVDAGQSIYTDEAIVLTCKSNAEIADEEIASKAKDLEATFPVEYAKRAAVVAITNARATDVFDDEGNSYDVTKFHSYDDTTGNTYDYYFVVKAWGNWSAKDDYTWHVESLVLEHSFGTKTDATLDVNFDGTNYTVSNIAGTFGNNDLGEIVEGYSKADLYLIVPLELIENDRGENKIDSHRSWVDGQFSIWDGSHKELTKVIKGNLNDEKSFEHIGTTYSEIFNEDIRDERNEILKSANIQARVEIGDLWIVTEFSAKNAFDATIKNTAYGIASFSNNTVSLVAIE